MITAVLPLSSESLHNDWETRYMLRSMEKHLDEEWELLIVGHRPKWLKADPDIITHIPAGDPYRTPKDANIINKLLLAAILYPAARSLLMVMDDQLFLRPTRAEDCRPYTIPAPTIDSDWSRSWRRGAAMLTSAGLPCRNFEAHTPIVMTRGGIGNMLQFPTGGTVHTLYFNALNIVGTEMRDWVVAKFYAPEEDINIAFKLSNHRFASYNDEALKMRHFKKCVEELFPEPSRFES